MMTALSLSREKERGTFEVLLVSPLHPWQIIVGKVIPYLGLAMGNVVTVLLAAWLVFDVPFRGSVTCCWPPVRCLRWSDFRWAC